MVHRRDLVVTNPYLGQKLKLLHLYLSRYDVSMPDQFTSMAGAVSFLKFDPSSLLMWSVFKILFAFSPQGWKYYASVDLAQFQHHI